MKDLVSVFPGLDLGIDANKTLSKVNNFEAIEISSEIGKITFAGDKTVKADLNLWYSSAEQETPLIVEFTFNYEAKKQDEAKRNVARRISTFSCPRSWCILSVIADGKYCRFKHYKNKN